MAVNGVMVLREFYRLEKIEKALEDKISRAKVWSGKWWHLLDQLDLVVTQKLWLGSLKLAGFQSPNTPPQLKDWALILPSSPDSPHGQGPVFLKNSEAKA